MQPFDGRALLGVDFSDCEPETVPASGRTELFPGITIDLGTFVAPRPRPREFSSWI